MNRKKFLEINLEWVKMGTREIYRFKIDGFGIFFLADIGEILVMIIIYCFKGDLKHFKDYIIW